MHKLKLYVLLCTLAVGGAAFGQERPYALGSTTTMLNKVRQELGAARQQSGISRLQLQVSPKLTFPAAVNYRLSNAQGQEQIVGSIERVPNSSFYLYIENNTVRGHIIMGDSKTAYRYTSDNNGNVFVEETDINTLVCINYNKVTVQGNGSPATTTGGAVSSNAVAAVGDLQSYPGGNGCVLLDFDGQYVSGTPWNNGNPINAAPANLTDAEKQAVWEIVSEDYRPFHLNVTTNEAVFNTYPRNRRMRCIFTPTNTAAPGAGGVAYLNSFNWNDETPCWVFNGGIKGAGEAGSHEVGHTFGLSHDGRTTPKEEYYQGQGSWAPIMGVGYYKPIVHWSKGEYANSSQKEDDLAKISSATYGVGYRADDYGNTTAAAGALTVAANGDVNSAGLIERTGDVDMFSFTTGGGNVTLNFTSNSPYPNLDILATLYNSAGASVATSNPSGLNASISTTLAAGTYYVSVTGTGAGDPVTTGYSNYGSLGKYAITGNVAGGASTAIATFYKDCNFTGAYAIGLNAGDYTTAQLVAKGIIDNDISSIKISAGYEVVLFKNDNFTGGSITLSGDQACLVNNTWNDSTSSLRIRSIAANTPPGVTISSPASGSTHAAPASIAINVNATDADGSIAKVEFYNGNTRLGEDATAPYSYVWSSIVAGSYTIRAVATDDRGGQATAQVNVTVSSGAGVTVYKHCNYGGYAVQLPLGTYTLNQLMLKGVLNDDISSLQVNSGYELVLYRDDNLSGPAYLFRSNYSCLVSVGLSNGTTVNLNDWTTSIVVRQSTARTYQHAESVAPLDGAVIPALTVSPNPASNKVMIQYGEPGYFDVNIIDVNGSVVYKASKMKSGQSINVSGLQTGVYFVRINTGKDIITKKIIKQ